MASSDLLEPPNSLILHRSFSDVDWLAEVVSARRQVCITQLSRDSLHCDLLLAEFDCFQFAFLESNCPLRFVGPKGSGWIDFALPLQTTEQYLVAHHTPIQSDTLFGFDCHRENNVILPGNLKLGVFQTRTEILKNCVEVMDRLDIDQRFLASNFLRCPTTVSTMQVYLRDLLWLVKYQPDFLTPAYVQRLILEDFLPLLVSCIPPQNKKFIKPPAEFRRAHLVRQAEDYMIAHLDQPLTLKDLCYALNTSSRALSYGFQDVFGMSPMAYLKVLRLHGVHRTLRSADPAKTIIADIAAQFGFWSLGHFTHDYKKMFGQLPSETLNR